MIRQYCLSKAQFFQLGRITDQQIPAVYVDDVGSVQPAKGAAYGFQREAKKVGYVHARHGQAITQGGVVANPKPPGKTYQQSGNSGSGFLLAQREHDFKIGGYLATHQLEQVLLQGRYFLRQFHQRLEGNSAGS